MFVKLIYKEEIRLLKLDEKAFDSLQTTLPSTFKTHLPSPIILQFFDDSNDLITVTNFEDLEFLSKNFKNPLRIHINAQDNIGVSINELKETKKKPSFEEISEEKKDTEKNQKAFEGVECDGCGVKPILSVRYKCLSCENYDLCGECEAKNVHSQHVFAKIKSPQQEIPQKTKEINFPGDFIKMAQPFLANLKQGFKENKGFFKDHCDFFKGKKNCCFKQNCCGTKKPEETEEKTNKPEQEGEDKNKKIEEIARNITEIMGGNLEENIEMVKGFEGNLDMNYILNILFKN